MLRLSNNIGGRTYFIVRIFFSVFNGDSVLFCPRPFRPDFVFIAGLFVTFSAIILYFHVSIVVVFGLFARLVVRIDQRRPPQVLRKRRHRPAFHRGESRQWLLRGWRRQRRLSRSREQWRRVASADDRGRARGRARVAEGGRVPRGERMQRRRRQTVVRVVMMVLLLLLLLLQQRREGALQSGVQRKARGGGHRRVVERRVH